MSRNASGTSSETYLKVITENMNEGFTALLVDNTMSVQLLEGLAKVRFSLSVVADILEKDSSSKQKTHPSSPTKQLIYTAQNVCTDLHVNVIDTSGCLDTTGPVVYLMRLLVRQYGMPCLEKVANTYPWVVPQQLKCIQEVSEVRIHKHRNPIKKDIYLIHDDHMLEGVRYT